MASGVAADPVKPQPSEGKGGTTGTFKDETISVNGKNRAYRLVVPKTLDCKKPAPLLFAFHGLGDSKDLMPLYSQLDKFAEDSGYVLVYPNGVNKMWPLLINLAKDDLAFFDSLYESITGKYHIDLNRVYLTGMSNGSYFTHVVASERSDKIAAIACHSGGLGLVAFSGVKVKNKYAVLVIHGDKDSIVKVDEGRKTRDAYTKREHPVEYVEIAGLNHFWATKQDSNEKIGKFFEAHPRGVKAEK